MNYLTELSSLLLLLGIGVFAGHFKILRRTHVDGVLRYIQFIALPVLIVVKILQTGHLEFSFEPILVYYLPTGLLFFISFLIARNWLHLSIRNSGLLAFGSTFSNLVLLGFPVISIFFEDKQMVNFFLILSVHALFLQLMTLFSQVYSKSIGWRRTFRKFLHILKLSPIIGALVIAHFLRAFEVELPDFMLHTGEMLGQSTSAAAFVSIGVLLSRLQIRGFLQVSLITSLMKLVIHPLLIMATGYLFGLSWDQMKLYVLMGSFPAGILTALISKTYSASSGFSSIIVSLTSVLSVVTLFVVIYVLF